MYKNLNPKYIELYSSNPPTIAPRILHERALAVEPQDNSSLENARPEKKTGKVNIIGTKNFKYIVG